MMSIIGVMMMIYRPWRAVDLACWVCLYCSFVHLCAFRHSLLFYHWTPLPCTDEGVKIIDFHGDFYCLLIYFCGIALVIFQKLTLPEGQFFALKYYFSLTHKQGLLLTRAHISLLRALILMFFNGHFHHLVIWSKKLDNGNFYICYIWIYSNISKCLNFTMDIYVKTYLDIYNSDNSFTIDQKTMWSNWIRHSYPSWLRNSRSTPYVVQA